MKPFNVANLLRRLGLIIVLSLTIITVPVFAETIDISEAQINKKMGETFPFKRKFQQVEAEFSQPSIILNPLSVDDDITITTLITATDNSSVVKAQGEISGKLEFDEVFKVILFRKPKLDDFTIIESNVSEQEQNRISRVVRQSMGNNLPKIVFADLNKIPLKFGATTPVGIEVQLGKLQVELANP